MSLADPQPNTHVLFFFFFSFVNHTVLNGTSPQQEILVPSSRRKQAATYMCYLVYWVIPSIGGICAESLPEQRLSTTNESLSLMYASLSLSLSLFIMSWDCSQVVDSESRSNHYVTNSLFFFFFSCLHLKVCVAVGICLSEKEITVGTWQRADGASLRPNLLQMWQEIAKDGPWDWRCLL